MDGIHSVACKSVTEMGKYSCVKSNSTKKFLSASKMLVDVVDVAYGINSITLWQAVLKIDKFLNKLVTKIFLINTIHSTRT